ncbi:hypothetical protein MRX96_023148 [Rhipicephalus microplus]
MRGRAASSRCSDSEEDEDAWSRDDGYATPPRPSSCDVSRDGDEAAPPSCSGASARSTAGSRRDGRATSAAHALLRAGRVGRRSPRRLVGSRGRPRPVAGPCRVA